MNVGFQPKSAALRLILNQAFQRADPTDQIIVHHVTDTAGGVQFEIERRSKLFGIRFERVRM